LSDGLKPIATLRMPQRGISNIAGGFNRRNIGTGTLEPEHWNRNIGTGTLEPEHWNRNIGTGTLEPEFRNSMTNNEIINENK
jgi:hypothetical protein